MKRSKMLILFSTTNASLGMFLIRLMFGTIFMAHGSQKLFAWFGGPGLEGTAQFMASLGLTPSYLMAMLSGCGEFFGGLCLFLGFLTRPAGFVLVINMIVATLAVTLPNGFFITNPGLGSEYNFALLVTAFAFMLTGPGCYAIDTLIYRSLKS